MNSHQKEGKTGKYWEKEGEKNREYYRLKRMRAISAHNNNKNKHDGTTWGSGAKGSEERMKARHLWVLVTWALLLGTQLSPCHLKVMYEGLNISRYNSIGKNNPQYKNRQRSWVGNSSSNGGECGQGGQPTTHENIFKGHSQPKK